MKLAPYIKANFSSKLLLAVAEPSAHDFHGGLKVFLCSNNPSSVIKKEKEKKVLQGTLDPFISLKTGRFF